MNAERFELTIAPTARRQFTDKLPKDVALAAYEFIVGPLLDISHRVGKWFRPPLDDRCSACGGTYRVIYRLVDKHRMIVVGVVHRADAYRRQ